MLPSTSTILATAAVLVSSATALPNFLPIFGLRQTEGTEGEITDPAFSLWVTVDEVGSASTVTPALSTVSGTTTIVNAAPAEITGTVVTIPYAHTTSTVTGTPAPPKATGNTAGAFPVCNNLDGENAPWCSPAKDVVLLTGTTYYFTWDAKFFDAPNATLVVEANYFNTTTGNTTSQAFESPKLPASRGFWAFYMESGLVRSQMIGSENVTLQLATLPNGGNASQVYAGPAIAVALPTGPPATTGAFVMPKGEALYIGLPVIGGFILLCVVGVCIWNRKSRKIGLGNIMSRSRHGYGVRKSARSRLGLGKMRRGGGNKNDRIQLQEREIMFSSEDAYRDVPEPPSNRDSNDLGSLAGTPVEDRRMNFDRPQTRDGHSGRTGNAFRDELKRQEGERF